MKARLVLSENGKKLFAVITTENGELLRAEVPGFSRVLFSRGQDGSHAIVVLDDVGWQQ